MKMEKNSINSGGSVAKAGAKRGLFSFSAGAGFLDLGGGGAGGVVFIAEEMERRRRGEVFSRRGRKERREREAA